MEYQLKNKTIELTDEEVKEITELSQKKGVEIKNTFGDVIYTSTKSTLKEAVEEVVSSEANLSGADLIGVDLSGANLFKADLSGVDLSEANLSEANFSGANLSRANLFRVDLRGANLSRANLFRVDLSRANLSGADLRGVDLSEADLSGVEMHNVKFYGKGGTTRIKKSQLNDFLQAIGVIVED